MDKYSWKKPTLEEIKIAVAELGGTAETGRLVGVKRRAVERWVSGTTKNMGKGNWLLIKRLLKRK